MTTFFIDLWHDLREKRLWPVAVGLVAAIAAIPIVLFKPASGESSPTPGPIASAPQLGDVLPSVTVDASTLDKGSKLDTFTAHNPFKPMKDLNKTQVASTTGSTPAAAAKTSASPSGSGTGSAPHTSSGSSGSGSSGSSGSVTTPQVSQQTTSWIYTATFEFGKPGHMKKMKNVQPFTMLPDEANASLIFASAGADGKSAIFYIQDVRFQAQGEGHCNAPGAKCRFVTLNLKDSGNEEAFISTDGITEYDVKLLSIGKKTISDSASSKKSTSKSPKGKRVAGASTKPAEQSSLDFLPVLLGFSNTTTRTK